MHVGGKANSEAFRVLASLLLGLEYARSVRCLRVFKSMGTMVSMMRKVRLPRG
jgi:hypothetical protein